MKKIAFMFPGQGSQYVGMGREIMKEFPNAARLMERAKAVLEMDIEKLCFAGPAKELNNTRNTQPAIYIVSMMINRVLSEKGIEPAVVAGHSLGEYSALAAAGVFSFEDGLRLVRQRGILMDEALPGGQGIMAAVIGLDPEQILSICQQVGGICEVANYNSPQQIVISGEVAATREAMKLADESGARRVVELDVSGPFHSSLMRPAREKLVGIIKEIDFKEPSVPVIANTTANYVKDVEEIKEALINQLTSSVRWVESINLMVKDGVNTFIEVGPGRVLKSLLRKINRSVKAYNVEDIKSLNQLLKEL